MISEIDMIVEVPYRSFVKYEFDEKINSIRCDRILNTSMTYPGNYGYIPNTLSGDGDPLDILMLSDYQIYPGTTIRVKIIGVLITEDEKGQDEKILAVPGNKVDPNYREINDLDDLSGFQLKKIRHFFEHYKDIDESKWVKVQDFKNAKEAFKIYETSLNN